MFLIAFIVISHQTITHAQAQSEPRLTELKKSSQFVISPKSVLMSDSITLTFPSTHPKNMSVRTPSGEWFVVHEKAEKIAIIPYKKFARAKSFQVKIVDVKGVK